MGMGTMGTMGTLGSFTAAPMIQQPVHVQNRVVDVHVPHVQTRHVPRVQTQTVDRHVPRVEVQTVELADVKQIRYLVIII